MTYIRFTSHRARRYGLSAIERKPQGYYSFARKTHPGGIYAVTDEELTAIQASRLAGFTRVRGPYDDLMACWS